MKRRISDRTIAEARAINVGDVASQRGFSFNRHGDHDGPCPRCGGTDRFSISIRKNAFLCRQCHPEDGGGAISLVMFLDGVGFREAVTTLAGQCNARPTSTPRPAPIIKPAETNDDSMHKIWREAHDPRDTLVKTYFDGRGLELDDDLCGRVLRFHPSVWLGNDAEGISIYRPALIAAFRPIVGDDETTAPQAIHRIFLNPDGSQLKKKMLAPVAGCAVKLDPDTDVSVGLGIAEGIETALKIRATGWRPIWAMGSAGAIRSLAPIPGIACLTIFADNDVSGTGQTAAHECAQRWAAAGCEVIVRIPPNSGIDWLEALS